VAADFYQLGKGVSQFVLGIHDLHHNFLMIPFVALLASFFALLLAWHIATSTRGGYYPLSWWHVVASGLAVGGFSLGKHFPEPVTLIAVLAVQIGFIGYLLFRRSRVGYGPPATFLQNLGIGPDPLSDTPVPRASSLTGVAGVDQPEPGHQDRRGEPDV
jgi:hypothetical protein